jgi:hypothetical protein
LGCKAYSNFETTTTANDNDLYGLCMRGFIQMINSQAINGRLGYLTTLVSNPIGEVGLDANIYIRHTNALGEFY